MVTNRVCSQQDTITGSSSNPGGSSVEESGLVSSNSGNAGGLSMAHFPTTRPVAERPETQSNRDNSSTSCMACFRKRSRNDCLFQRLQDLC